MTSPITCSPVHPIHYDFVESTPTQQLPSSTPGRSQPTQTATPSAAQMARGHYALQKLLNDSHTQSALKDIFARHLNAALAVNLPDHSLDIELRNTRLLRNSIAELMGCENMSATSETRAACEDLLSSLDVTISRLQRLPTIHEEAADVHEYYDPSHHHDPSFFDEMKKRFLGTSDLDEGPHAVVGAKAGISEIINRDNANGRTGDPAADGQSPNDHLDPAAAQLSSMKTDVAGTLQESSSRLHDFQMHSVPHSAGELATDMALSGVLGLAGLMAATAGRGERIEASHEKREATELKRVLEQEKSLLEAQLSPDSGQHTAPFSRDFLKRELLIVDSQLASVNYTLAHVGKKKQVGVGSEMAGWQMMLKGVIDSICKPLAFAGTGGAHVGEIAASVSGFATSALSPGAAASGLWMGINAKRFFSTERKQWKSLLATAVNQSGLQTEHMPENIREDFNRVFINGKWKSHTDRLHSVNKLLNWFVGGMSGYAGAMTGISIHNLVQLAIAGSLIAELSMSGGIITATGMVMVGTLAFLKHHAKFHEYEHWLESGHPVVDLDLFRELAAGGGNGIGQHAVDTVRFYEAKENRRQDFLHGLAQLHGLRYDGIRLHSTDPEEVKTARKQQRQASRPNASARFMNVAARGREGASYLAHSAEQIVNPSEWRKGFHKARTTVREGADEGADTHGHHHQHHHGHAHGHHDDHDGHNHRGLGALTSGLRTVAKPLKDGVKIAGKTVSNTFDPAAQKAKQTYANHTSRLTETKLAELLLSPASRNLVRQYIEQEAAAHAQYAQNRLNLAMEGYRREVASAEGGTQLPDGLKKRFRKKGLRLARDQQHVQQANNVLKSIQTDGAISPEVLANAVHLQFWSNPSAQPGSDHDGAQALAKFLWKGAHEEFRKTRLCLTTGLLKLAPLLESTSSSRSAEPGGKFTESAWPIIEPTQNNLAPLSTNNREPVSVAMNSPKLGTPKHFGQSVFGDWPQAQT